MTCAWRERHGRPPPAVCIIGKKNSGKTTLVVALLAELRRRGLRVASIKHGHHAFETDQPGKRQLAALQRGGRRRPPSWPARGRSRW